MNADRTNHVPILMLHDMVERLDRLKIDYMLSGSMAMFAYTVYRYTADLDIIIELKNEQINGFTACLEPDYYIPYDSMRRAVASERMFNVINIEYAFKIDCIIRKSSDFQKNAFDRRRVVDYFGKDIYVISLEDLILSKLSWSLESNSEKQLTDIQNLLRNQVDENYIELWSSSLGVTERYDQIRSEVRK